MPITVSRKASSSAGTNFFISSSFQSENNLLTVTSVEVDDFVVDVIPEREMLREHRDAITKDFGSEKKPLRNLHALIRENLQSTPSSMGSPVHKSSTLTLLEYDESRVERREILLAMAKLYSFIIDMNHVPNILSEFSYLVNLLNTEHNPYEQQQQQNYHLKSSSCDIASHLLKNFHNCIFFATCVLNHQKQTLAMLDCTTIRVLCDCERIQKLAASLYEYLRNVMQKKMQMDTLARGKSGRGNANSINKVVFYQQETDNRDNFPSDREFGAFKKQRDLFYGILR
jgi:codanin-1